MQMTRETRALGWALLAALLSLAGAGLGAAVLRSMTSSSFEPLPVTEPAASAAAPDSVRQGHEFFEMSCSECHGDDAHGDEGPDLHNLAISNRRIATTITKGVKGEMPAFAKTYDERQIAALVAFLRTQR
jgi:mono/diheme cytochrome c family protein